MQGKHFVYYDRAGNKQVRFVEFGNPYRNSTPVTAYVCIGYMSKADAENMPDYNADYDVSHIMDINGYALKTE